MKALPRVAWWLGYGGLLPFLALTVLLLLGEGWLPAGMMHSHLAFGLAAYAAVIASFLGAVHWGVVLTWYQNHWGEETLCCPLGRGLNPSPKAVLP